MFVDEARVYIKAGDGGDGCNSMHRDRCNRKGWPDGGYGGDGGDVVFTVDNNVQTLLDFQYRQHFVADSGSHGSSNDKKGARGENLIIRVPAGTIIKDAETGLVLRELLGLGSSVTIAHGGAGGKGNSRYSIAQKGLPGEERTVRLELKIMADVGIIGYPNAGKSTLISKISSAHPKIASYPFTTKEPVLGVVKLYDDATFVVAEVPGLIEGAHEGRGLGDRFLRHVERTKVLIHLIDVSGFEGRDPYQDYMTLTRELRLYSKALIKKPQFIALNKIDLEPAKTNIRKFKKHFPRRKIFPISAATGEGIKELLVEVYKKVQRLKRHAEE